MHKNRIFCLLLVAGFNAYGMDQQKVDLSLTRQQADDIKDEVVCHFDRKNEKFSVIPHDVMELITNNPEIHEAFKNQSRPVQAPESKKSRLDEFKMIVDRYVKDNK